MQKTNTKKSHDTVPWNWISWREYLPVKQSRQLIELNQKRNELCLCSNTVGYVIIFLTEETPGYPPPTPAALQTENSTKNEIWHRLKVLNVIIIDIYTHKKMKILPQTGNKYLCKIEMGVAYQNGRVSWENCESIENTWMFDLYVLLSKFKFRQL